jgi:hypothetical protein
VQGFSLAQELRNTLPTSVSFTGEFTPFTHFKCKPPPQTRREKEIPPKEPTFEGAIAVKHVEGSSNIFTIYISWDCYGE